MSRHNVHLLGFMPFCVMHTAEVRESNMHEQTHCGGVGAFKLPCPMCHTADAIGSSI